MPITAVSIDNFPISYKATIEMLHFDAQNFGGNLMKFAPVFTLTTTNLGMEINLRPLVGN